MDYEERLASAERSESPSLVGSSIRSADDSPHRNYIHPEKYKSTNKKTKSKLSKLNPAIAASLDDLIGEGALINSEEDFEKYLDSDGSVRKDVKYTPKEDEEFKSNEKSKDENKDLPTEKEADKVDKEISKGSKPESIDLSDVPKNPSSSFYKQEDYSTPNLSQYQLDQDIKNHNELLNHVKSYDLEKLPRSTSSFHDDSKATTYKPQTQMSAAQQQRSEGHLHTPTFFTDRPRSRSRSANPSSRVGERSSSRSSTNATRSKTHLARGDSYKNIHGDEPEKYELPPEFAAQDRQLTEADEEDGRRSRQSRPTMGESIAKAEAKKAELDAKDKAFTQEHESNPVTRDPSLVTTGDYTNFEVDSPHTDFEASNNLYSSRSISSTNYLRSISRSRSRARHPNPMDEKNDANVDTLVEEGALISDDPYASIDQLDTMVEEVLHGDNSSKNFLPLTEEDEESEKVEKTDASSTKEDSSSKQSESKESTITETKPKGSTNSENETQPTSSKVHEEVINEDAKKAKFEGNEKDDAHPEPLKEEGALTSDDPYERVDESELEKEGISTGDKQANEEANEKIDKAVESPLKKEIKPESNDKIPDESEKLEKTNDKATLLEGVDNADGPAELENLEEEEKEGIKENEEEAKEEKEGKIPKDEEAELESAEKNKPTLVQGGEEEIKSVSKEDEDNKEPKEEAKLEQDKEVEPKDTLIQSSGDVDGPSELEKQEEEEIDGAKLHNKEIKEEEKGKTPKDEQAQQESAEKNSAATKGTDDSEEFEDLDVSPEEIRKHLESLPIYIFTSLAGGMQIMPRTNRLATILQANGIKFEYRDLGTDEEAKKIWKRQSNGKTLPGIVRGDDFIGNWQEIDEANEEYKLKELLYETL
ncbi:uncharacterized protein KGF55_002787 [Candida pseudojiufengensis]|uniref:uncharacterized protein n=1 Tax=Candida pseudojiufengensis TaxID=497109 RepID=UPI002223F370|nr:uncharacterized protein KGF55_002787 [Candida pseudojiufengensis]KAI5962995.1 hypothetical protein KGF55_002787 [Candida pseudojiufengensis]